MKKIVIALAMAGLGFTTTMAQDTEMPTSKYSVTTNFFGDNWFTGGGISLNSFYSSQEQNVDKLPFSDKRGTLGLNAFIGKWATPGVGFRLKLEGVWGKQVNTDSHHPLYNALGGHFDVLFNTSNLFGGYSETRVWNFIPYIGGGLVHNYDNHLDNLTVHFGLLNNFRLSSRWQIFADLNFAATDGNFDGAAGDPWGGYDHMQMRHWDKKVSLDLGVTYNFSWRKGGTTTWEKQPNIEDLMAMNREQMDALNLSIMEQQEENAELRRLLAEKQTPPAAECKQVFAGTVASVFFNINSSVVACRKDLVNVKEMAEYAKAHKTRILVTGYADSKTGSPERNQQLSLERAETVAGELVKMGVDRDSIIIEAKGGVDNLSPFSYNRRATVKIQ